MSSLLLTLLLTAAGVATEPTVTTLDGRTLSGKLTAWSPKELTIDAGGKEQKLSTSEVLDVRFPQKPAQAPAALNVEFVDGTRLGYATFTLADRKATITGGHFAKTLT